MADDTKDTDRKASESSDPAQTTSDAIISTLTLTTEQTNYLEELRQKEKNFDSSVVIGGPRKSAL
jgi:hypothetical protein